jgi:hypothetical protein
MNNLQAGEGPGHGGNGQAEMEGHQAQGEVWQKQVGECSDFPMFI